MTMMPIRGEAITKQQLQASAEKLSGDDAQGRRLRWHTLICGMTGGMILNYGKDLTADHLTEWTNRLTLILDEMLVALDEVNRAAKPLEKKSQAKPRKGLAKAKALR